MKQAKILLLLNDLMQLYWEDGYDVNEILLPNEWYESLDLGEVDGLKCPIVKNEYGVCKIFPTQSRHFQMIVTPTTRGGVVK